MEYYCYISQDKVDKLLAEFENQILTENSITSSNSSSEGFNAGVSNVLTVLKANLKYGRTDVIQKNIKLKETYSNRLNRLLEHIAQNDKVNIFNWSDHTAFNCYYYFEGDFKVKELDQQLLMASIEITHDTMSLILDCSIKYFSDEPIQKNCIHIHSSNYAFFQRNLPTRFGALFFLTNINDTSFYGSPIFLKLNSDIGILL